MMTRIIGDDIREFAVGELWETIERIMEERGLVWQDLAVRLDWSMSELRNYRVALQPDMLCVGTIRKMFAALGYDLSLTVAIIPENTLTERKESA